jgi:hypothetical protein
MSEDFAERAAKIGARVSVQHPLEGTGISYGFGDPEKEAQAGGKDWMKIPARNTVTVVILSEKPVKYAGHWRGKGMAFCTGPTCLLCARQILPTTRYAFSVYLPDADTRALLDLPASATRDISSVAEQTGFLRGLMFTLHKEGQRVNGKIKVKSNHLFSRITELPDADDPAQHLLRQYRASSDVAESGR